MEHAQRLRRGMRAQWNLSHFNSSSFSSLGGSGFHTSPGAMNGSGIAPGIMLGRMHAEGTTSRATLRSFSSGRVLCVPIEGLQSSGAAAVELGSPPPLNEVQVPLISPHLRSQLFPPPSSPYSPAPPTAAAIAISRAHLQSHGLLAIPSPSSKPPKPPAAAIDFVLPPLQGPTITHHFHALANSTCAPYLSLAQSFASAPITPLPTPDRWSLVAGWTFYSPDGSCESIPFPEDGEKALVFDVETLPYKGGDFPIMAVAVGELGWYGWCSPWLTGDDESPRHLIPLGPSPVESSSRGVEADSTLFEVEGDSPRLIIGHNVLFDRARVESEYTLRRPSTRWLDTLSLHVAVSGLTNPQRPSYMKYRKEQNLAEAADQEVDLTEESTTRPKKSSTPPASPAVKDWKDVSSMNSLVEVARLHCGTKVDKSLRNVFIDPTTTILDVREHFQDLIAYCATDVLTTLDVYRVLLPKFLRTCPHPASFSGILLMSQPILPVDAAWPQYLDRAERTYEKSLTQVKDALKVLAEEARAKFDKTGDDGKYLWEHDLWLRQLDWSPKKARRLKGFVPDKQVKAAPTKTEEKVLDLESPPKWFVSFTEEDKSTTAALHAQVMATLLLQVTYKGFPVVFSKIHGWTYAVPSTSKSFVPDATELPIDDPMTPTGARLYSLPPRGTARVLSIMSKPMRKRIEAGILASPFGEYAIGVSSEMGSKERRGVEKKLASLAKAALDVPLVERLKDPWLAQLDWTPSRSKIVTIAPPPLSPVDPAVRDELVWPKWYHDLDVPGVGLDISIGKRTSPILLKLQWKGYPVVHSKQHGWIYRVPAEEVMTVLTANSVTALDFDEVADATLKEDDTAAYLRLPHPDGEGNNVGSPLSKPFLKAFKDGILSSTYPVAAAAIAMNASCSYWTSARERISNQMVVWEGDAKILAPTPDPAVPSSSLPFTAGLILPQVTPMGTVTRRAVERTWLTASNAKKDRVGSELKSMVKAPPGYAIVGADVDSEELWICSVMGDAQFGVHGATAIGWMTLEGTKSAGTDLHSKSASILGISRDDAKVFNYSRIYGAGVKHAVQLLLKSNPNLSVDEATKLAKALYAGTKGLTHRGGAFERNFWHGGTESFVFNKLEEIAQSDRPRTPALGCGLTDALTKEYLPAEGRDKAGNAFMPSRINWVVQSSGVDYLHLLLVSMEYLTKRYGIDARYMISVHDEIRYLVKEEDKYRAAMALQISNIWTRTLFSYRLQMGDLPQSCAFFSAVDVDHCFRKEVNMTCLTPSNPDSIPFGESLDISDSLSLTSNGSLYADGRSMLDSPSLDVSLVPTLSPAEAQGEGHRVDTTPFLVAQTKTKTEDVKKVWNESRHRKPSASAARSWASKDYGQAPPTWKDTKTSTVKPSTSTIKSKSSVPKSRPPTPIRRTRTIPLTRSAELEQADDWNIELPDELEDEAFTTSAASLRTQV